MAERIDLPPATLDTAGGPVDVDYTDLDGMSLLLAAADGDGKAMETLLLRGQQGK